MKHERYDVENRCDLCGAQSIYTVFIMFLELNICDKMGCQNEAQKTLLEFTGEDYNEKRKAITRRS